MYKTIAVCMLPLLIACSDDSNDEEAANGVGGDSADQTANGTGDGSDSDTSDADNSDQAGIDALRDAIVTGTDSTASNNWLCEFLGTDGNAQFTDNYGFYTDDQGTASHGGFVYSFETDDIMRIEKQGSTDVYEIAYIEFTSTGFANDGFTAIVDGQYFDTGDIVQFAIDCSRTGEAMR